MCEQTPAASEPENEHSMKADWLHCRLKEAMTAVQVRLGGAREC
jgi:hypothetical protein